MHTVHTYIVDVVFVIVVVVLQELDLTSTFVSKAALIVKRKLDLKEPKHTKPDRKKEEEERRKQKAPVKQQQQLQQQADPVKNKSAREPPGDAIKTPACKDVSSTVCICFFFLFEFKSFILFSYFAFPFRWGLSSA